MQNEDRKKRFAGKGYYIALIACIAAVGISGYVFVRTTRDSAVETVAVAAASPSASEEASSADEAEVSPSASTEADAQTDQMEDAYEETMGETALTETVCWPLEGEIIAVFSQDTLTYSQTMADWRTHEGLDIAADVDAPVSATQDGTVTAVYEDDYLGTVVVVSHSGDLATLYANLSETPAVAVGDSVTAGQVIGQVGDTALLETAEVSHLHFEVYENGEAIDPLAYLPE